MLCPETKLAQNRLKQVCPDHPLRLAATLFTRIVVQSEQRLEGYTQLIILALALPLFLFWEALRQIIVSEKGAVIKKRLAPRRHNVGIEQLFILRDRIGLSIGKAAEHAHLHIAGSAPHHLQHPWAHQHRLIPWQRLHLIRLIMRRNRLRIALDQHEIEPLIVIGQDQKIIARAIAESPDDLITHRHRQTRTPKEEDVEGMEALVKCHAPDIPDRAAQSSGAKAQRSRRLPP